MDNFEKKLLFRAITCILGLMLYGHSFDRKSQFLMSDIIKYTDGEKNAE